MSAAPWWLLRHAQPDIDAGVCYGRLDVPAPEAATAQAAQNFVAHAVPLLAACAKEPLHIRSSPLQRCWHLAQAIAQALPATLHADERLAEMDFGCWEGQRWSAIEPAQYQAWTAQFGTYRVGGHGEAAADVLRRVQAALREDAAHAHAPRLWVTHAGVQRAVHVLRSGLAVEDLQHASQWPQQQASACGQWLRLQ